MSQDALTKLAMELAEWPSDGREKVTPQGRVNEKMWLQRRAELINKPSWGEAPEWAEYLAQDKDGEWFWFEGCPEQDVAQWAQASVTSRYIYLGRGKVPAGHDWRQTLEGRPILDERSEPEAVEWDGEGLPPVGCECDCWHTGTHQGVVTVRYMGSEMCVLLNHDYGSEQCGPIDAYSFRPIRSEEDRFVEAVNEVMKTEGLFSLSRHARALYRDGYRKQEAE